MPRLLVPEVVQTSGMDCGPATLACLLGGFGIRASYARLRDACHTDVDGTSIDAMEDAAVLLGLDARQLMLPPADLLADPASTLPAIVVTRVAGDMPHFVVVWRRHGRLLQVMDPGVGRRWVPVRRFLDEVYVHEIVLPEADLGPELPSFATPEAPGHVRLRGAVFVHVAGRREVPADLPADLRAALSETDPRPGRFLRERLRAVGGLLPASGVAALAAAGVVAEAALFRSLLSGSGLRSAIPFLVTLALVLLALRGGLVAQVSGAGRRLERSLRGSLLDRLPRLPDRYVRSRPLSDLAERAHRLHRLRELPGLAVEAVQLGTQLLLVPLVIGLIDPPSALPAVVTVVVCTAVGFVLVPVQAERDLRLRHHVGALARSYLDALSGLSMLRAHRAESIVDGVHRGLLGHWATAVRGVHRSVLAAELLQGLFGLAGVAWLLAGAVGRVRDPATFLLLAYWGAALPLLGQQLGALARRYPAYRSATVRLLEPLTAPAPPPGEPAPDPAPAGGVRIALSGVSVVAAGQPVLSVDQLTIPAGSAVAVVGRSGSGKSTLAGLFLGWHTPSAGEVRIDGRPLDPVQLRPRTAWVDPAVAIWNRPVADNLGYATSLGVPSWVAADLGLAHLGGEPLGERGWSLPTAQAQRVRLGRAAAQRSVRLAILDEPFRGLAEHSRRTLLRRTRTWWPGATLLFVTHDVADTLEFDRVLVIDAGRITEDGPPETLAAQPDSRYRALLDAERELAGLLSGAAGGAGTAGEGADAAASGGPRW
jgi:ATP-binding cassette subfamily B protein